MYYVCTACVQVKYYRDTYAEHPEDRKNIEYTVHLDNEQGRKLLSCSQVKDLVKELSWILIDSLFLGSQSGARLAL